MCGRGKAASFGPFVTLRRECAKVTAGLEGQKLATATVPPDQTAMSQMSSVKAERARRNRAYVRLLLWQRQPRFAAVLASAELDLSCEPRGRGICQ